MSRVDAENSKFQEDPDARAEFTRHELRSLRFLLRRLRFLEGQIKENGGLAEGSSGGAAFAEWESEALEYVLVEIGFLQEVEETKK